VIFSAADCWAHAIKDHCLYFDKVINKNLAKFGGDLTKAEFKFITNNKEKIRDGSEAHFRILQNDYDAITSRLKARTKEKSRNVLKKIFDYETFSKKHKINWCAYKLCQGLKFLTCPYCNLAFNAVLFRGDDGLMRPSLDHFLDKSNYPLFALSLGNLIPSCHHCNSTLKGSTNFFDEEHLNPLDAAENLEFCLNVSPTDVRSNLLILETAELILKMAKPCVKSARSLDTFALAQRYQFLALEIRSIAKFMADRPADPSLLAIHREMAIRGINEGNYRDRIFGRMILDFAKCFLSD
jgi:hypothetical protein